MKTINKYIKLIFVLTLFCHYASADKKELNDLMEKFEKVQKAKKEAEATAKKDETATEKTPAKQITLEQSNVTPAETPIKPKKTKKKKAVANKLVAPNLPNPAPSAAPVTNATASKVESVKAIATNAEAAKVEPAKEYGISGSWGGLRTKWEDAGYTFAMVYKGEIHRNGSGGTEVHTSYLENLDIKLAIDGEKAFGRKGLSFLFYGLADKGANNGYKPTQFVGDQQGTSNIETARDDFKLYEAYFQQLFAEDKASILFGLHDLNTEFYVTDSSGQFLNSTMGVGRELSQTGVAGPSIFPTTSVALRLRFEPATGVYFQTGVFGAQAGNPDAPLGTHIRFGSKDGFLHISELGFTGSEKSPYKLAFGSWNYTRTFDHLTETVTDAGGNSVAKQSVSSGAYILFDKAITANSSAFFRYGVASPESNQMKDSMGAGFVIKGLIPKRGDDKLGIAFSRVTPGQKYKDKQEASSVFLKSDETSYELNYRIEFGGGIALTPDFQYVVNPGMSPDLKNAEVGILRAELSF